MPESSRAARNPYNQNDINQSLANYLATQNISSSKRPAPAERNERRQRQRQNSPDPLEHQTRTGLGDPPFPPPSDSDQREDDEPPPDPDPDLHRPEDPRTRPPNHEERTNGRILGAPSTQPIIGLDSAIDDLKITAKFIEGLKTATLDESNMSEEDIERLRQAEETFSLDVDDKHFVKALRTFLSTTNSSRETYNDVRTTMLQCYPQDPFLSFDQIKRRVEQLSGVVPIYHDMCIDTCAAFTGPFRDLDLCPICSAPRYHEGTRTPRRQFVTIPLGPVIQALYRSPETAEQMHYFDKTTEEVLEYARTHGGKVKEYNDITCGKDILDAKQAGRITKDDVVVQISLDGAQLYRDKDSDCWIFIYIIHNLPPVLRYKKAFVIPAGFIGGPHKPKHGDSYMYPALHHISALQLEGLPIWDAFRQVRIPRSIPFLAFATADGPGAAMMSGMVGHSGKFGCRLYCDLPGRRRNRDGHYYPAMQKPVDYSVAGCTHDDVTFADLHKFRQNVSTRYEENLNWLVQAGNPTQFANRRLESGLCKQTIFSGLEHNLGIPNIFPLDIMHLINLNDPDLFLSLWRGTMKCYAPDKREDWDFATLVAKVWEAHGQTVANATSFIPSSFGRAPRNIAEKVNSGYKASEYQLYLLGLAPTLLRFILTEKYWLNLCKYASGTRILQRWRIPTEELQKGHQLLCKFEKEFEDIYYQRREDRLHFVRQSIHLLTHIASETVRVGPLACYAQWTLETAIGNLGDEIRQDKDPYTNISQRGVLRAQLNSILAMLPDLNLKKNDGLPLGAKDLGDGYALLRACEETVNPVTEVEAVAIMDYWDAMDWPNRDSWPRAVMRWSRLRLPNGQTARSFWTESRSKRPLRRTTCVKLKNDNGEIQIAEIKYFFRLKFDDKIHSLALVSLFSPPDNELLERSFGAVYVSHYRGDDALQIIDVKNIDSVVSMFPDYEVTPVGDIVVRENQFSLLTHPFLELASLCGEVDADEEGDDEL